MAQLAARDAQLAAAQARPAVLAEQAGELRRQLGKGFIHLIEAAVLRQPVSGKAEGPVAAAPIRTQAR